MDSLPRIAPKLIFVVQNQTQQFINMSAVLEQIVTPSNAATLPDPRAISIPVEDPENEDAVEKQVPAEDPLEVENGTSTESPETPAPALGLTPLSQLSSDLPAIIREANYGEMWGIELKDEADVPTSIVLEKFLRANTKDVSKAKAQLTQALKWRKKMLPLKLLEASAFDAAKFGGLGFVTTYPKTDALGKEIVTWNIYGAVKDNKATFGNIEE